MSCRWELPSLDEWSVSADRSRKLRAWQSVKKWIYLSVFSLFLLRGRLSGSHLGCCCGSLLRQIFDHQRIPGAFDIVLLWRNDPSKKVEISMKSCSQNFFIRFNDRHADCNLPRRELFDFQGLQNYRRSLYDHFLWLRDLLKIEEQNEIR